MNGKIEWKEATADYINKIVKDNKGKPLDLSVNDRVCLFGKDFYIIVL